MLRMVAVSAEVVQYLETLRRMIAKQGRTASIELQVLWKQFIVRLQSLFIDYSASYRRWEHEDILPRAQPKLKHILIP